MERRTRYRDDDDDGNPLAGLAIIVGFWVVVAVGVVLLAYAMEWR